MLQHYPLTSQNGELLFFQNFFALRKYLLNKIAVYGDEGAQTTFGNSNCKGKLTRPKRVLRTKQKVFI